MVLAIPDDQKDERPDNDNIRFVRHLVRKASPRLLSFVSPLYLGNQVIGGYQFISFQSLHRGQSAPSTKSLE